MRRVIVALIALALLAVGVMAFGVQHARMGGDTRTISIGGEVVTVSLALTQEERARGLSGRSGLAEDEGMLFVFPKDGQYSFWMKDMLFPIDILWISRDGVITHVEKSLSPSTYPHTYTSESSSRFVLELPAGFTDAHGISVGDSVSL